jgi:hypothetical protein
MCDGALFHGATRKTKCLKNKIILTGRRKVDALYNGNSLLRYRNSVLSRGACFGVSGRICGAIETPGRPRPGA